MKTATKWMSAAGLAVAMLLGAASADANPFSAWQKAGAFKKTNTEGRLKIIENASSVREALALVAMMPELKGKSTPFLYHQSDQGKGAVGGWIGALIGGNEGPQLQTANRELQIQNGRFSLSINDTYIYHARPSDDSFSTKRDSRIVPIRTGRFRDNTAVASELLPGLTPQIIAKGARAALSRSSAQ